MKSRLFIIDGTSGIWKQDLIEYTENICSNAEVLKKFSTRPLRDGETKLDITQTTQQGLDQMHPDYTYRYAGHSYGISKTHISEALQARHEVFLIIRNFDVVQRIKADFPEYDTITVFIYSAYPLIEQRLGKPAEYQRQSIDEAFHDYLRHPEIYDYVVVNGGSDHDFYRIMDGVKTRVLTAAKAKDSGTSAPLSIRAVWLGFTRLPLREVWIIRSIIASILVATFGLGVLFGKLYQNYTDHKSNEPPGAATQSSPQPPHRP